MHVQNNSCTCTCYIILFTLLNRYIYIWTVTICAPKSLKTLALLGSCVHLNKIVSMVSFLQQKCGISATSTR